MLADGAQKRPVFQYAPLCREERRVKGYMDEGTLCSDRGDLDQQELPERGKISKGAGRTPKLRFRKPTHLNPALRPVFANKT